MVARFYYRSAAAETIEITDRIDASEVWELQERAEEGTVGQTQLWVDDPAMDLDLTGHLRFWVIEDTSEATDDVLFGGFIGGQVVSRGDGTHFHPLRRAWLCTITDANAVWNRRVMTGADCKRPDETDVQRVQWLFSTAETGIFDDETTYVSTASPVDMDEADYRRRYRDEVISSCSLDADKNWWCKYHETGTGREFFVWYGRDGLSAYDSDLFLTNDPAALDLAAVDAGTAVVYPIDPGAKLERDPSRVYTGVLLEYKKGAVYRKDPAAAFRRDTIIQAPHVKRKAKAIAIAERKLAKLDTQEHIIRTTVEVPASKATMLRAGMRVPFKATHLPEFTSWTWIRVLSLTIRNVPGADRYQLTIEATDTGDAADAPAPPAPLVQWVFLSIEGTIPDEITLSAYDDPEGAPALTLTGATLRAGTVNPPNELPGTYAGLVALPAGTRHRYWVLNFADDYHDFGPGVVVYMLRLLDGDGPGAVCRLGTPASLVDKWWVGDVNGDFTGSVPYGGVASPALLFGDDPRIDHQTAITATQEGGYGFGSAVIGGDWSAAASWTFDIVTG